MEKIKCRSIERVVTALSLSSGRPLRAGPVGAFAHSTLATLLQFRAFYRNLKLAVFQFAHRDPTYPLRANITTPRFGFH